jgi:UDP-N-acetylmuramoyl-tripeptide--D-alanyl-D-alanine ligase
MSFDAHEIARATGGRLVRPGPTGPVSTDTRRIQPGDWFLALAGERFDAHDFLGVADAARCAGVIAKRVPEGWTRGFVQVPDTLIALQDLARAVRKDHTLPVIAITGSAGKTTTRALIACALSPLGRIHQTPGNLNNHIGLPLTLLQAPVDASAWVLELGMNHAGEISLLADICRPTIRLITNVGAAHLEGLGSIEGVARAKGELFDGAFPGDLCIVNADDAHVSSLPIPPGVAVLRYGSPQGVDIRLTDAAVDPTSLSTRYRVETPSGVVFGQVPSPGLHLASNACAAIAVAFALHVPTEAIAASISTYAPVGMRQRIESGPGGIRVINDAYNANPLSTRAALDTLATVTGTRRVALLGDMLELGPGEAEGHRDILSHALGLGLDLIGLAGPRFAHAAESLGVTKDVICAPDATGLAAAIRTQLLPGDLVLLKGSRGIAMEGILHKLNEEGA